MPRARQGHRKAATKGRVRRAQGDVGKIRRKMPRTLQSHQTQERKVRKGFAHDGTKEDFVKRSIAGPSKSRFFKKSGSRMRKSLEKKRDPWRKTDLARNDEGKEKRQSAGREREVYC